MDELRLLKKGDYKVISKEELEIYFEKHKQLTSLSQLQKRFNISSKEISQFLDILISLEQEGKIILNEDNTCLSISDNYYLKHGIIKKSNRGNYYIKDNTGKRINLPYHSEQNVKAGDHVFVEEQEKNNSIKGYHEGLVVHKTGKPKMLKEGARILQAEIKKEIGNSNLYIIIDNKKIYVAPKNYNSAYPGDIVNVSILSDKKEAQVVDVIKRKNPFRVFKCEVIGEEKKWIPIGTTTFTINQIPNESVQVGDKVIASIGEKTKDGYNIEILQKLMEKNHFESMVDNILLDYGFNISFSQKAMTEAYKIPTIISTAEKHKRKDLRSIPTFTIDSEDAKDLDDAVSIEKVGDYYKLYVSIADVSYYVKPEMFLFKEALNFGTSIYPPGMVKPMLPKELSNGICSLSPNKDRLTKTCEFLLDKTGNVLDSQVYNSIINSNCKMSYEKVNRLLEGKEIVEEYLPYYNNLKDMYQLANLLQNKRLERGFICLESEELKIEVDSHGNPIKIKENAKGPAQLLIENFMVLTNAFISEYAYWLDIPFVYRNHEPPETQKARQIEHNLYSLNQRIKRLSNIQEPKVLQKVLLNLMQGRTKEEAKYISDIFLKSFSRAYYADINKGHYGLALNYYGTFTSPIRRASDLLNHMFIEEVINPKEKNHALEEVKENLEVICSHISKQEQNAELAEIDINSKLLYQLGLQYKDKPLNGTVTFLTDSMMYIKTEEQIPGFVPLNKKFKYDIYKKAVRDCKNNFTYHIGSKIPIRLSQEQKNGNVLVFFIDKSRLDQEKQLVKRREKK